MIADCLPGARVTVRVNGQALTEYATENDDMSANTFVEAVAGAEFEVVLNLSPPFAYRNAADRIRCLVTVDGEWIRTPIIQTHVLQAIEAIVEGPQETRNGVTTFRRLSFAQHASTDRRADRSTMKKLTNVGEIKVVLQRCRVGGPKPSPDNYSNFKGVGDHAVPEKALKGRSISNHTKLGRTENTAAASYVNVVYPYGEAPIATYIFQYRSRNDLQVEGIIDRTPSPVPLEERDPEELTPGELRELVRRSRAEKASTIKVKQEFKREKRARDRSVTQAEEGDDDDDEGDVTITSHTDRRKRARASMESAEMIDLTDD